MIPGIYQFQGSNRWLSNFWPALVKLDNFTYPSVENAYQAAKTDNEELRIPFALPGACTSGEAKQLGRKLVVRSNWDNIKIDVMYSLLKQKFAIYPLREQLLATENLHLSEGNTWGDVFWGVNLRTGKGENNLGQLLMLVREELQENT